MLPDYLKKYESLDLEAFIVANKAGWPQLEWNLGSFPFPIRYIDPATYRGQEFTRDMIALNEKAYGEKMAAPAWTFANFGTIGAGITGGFLSHGLPVSKFSMVGNIWDPHTAHDWTMLVDPEYEGRGLASITLGYALQAASDKQYFSFIAQTDNSSINLYLKLPHELSILAYGFVHTRRNSLLLKTKIPEQPFATVVKSSMPEAVLSHYPIAREKLPDGHAFWMPAKNHQLWLDLNEHLLTGDHFALSACCTEGKQIYLLVTRSAT
ncbi:hypothetical protein AUK40_05220 [Candidatus Wirthbacteria bacterium CG2_30_54_11]|uniref:N-acetyltransferase domain-containing protein n=1 Tax=Candidatus Wirthbacteria bacterium CG2_30_54_11 TaxID=1817892 RepID=A0A1J5IGI9_9BACT|nr:MAG: hypothetical protein AUK40_05220 [Candidatus Wirthbacteria bacterium CG2_30_54_11]